MTMKKRVHMRRCADTEKSCGAEFWLRWRRRRRDSVSRLRRRRLGNCRRLPMAKLLRWQQRQMRMSSLLAEAIAAGKEKRRVTTMTLKTCPRITPRLPRLRVCPISVHNANKRLVTEKFIVVSFFVGGKGLGRARSCLDALRKS